MLKHHSKPILALTGSIILALSLAGPTAVQATEAPSPHDGISCSLCHGGVQKIAVASTAPRSNKCLQCHTPNEAWQVRHPGLTRLHDSACLTCHDFHQSEAGFASTVVEASAPVGLDSGHCVACHNTEGNMGDLSPAHLKARELYHAEMGSLASVSPSEACLNCHGEGSTSTWQAQTEQSLTFRHQASHAYGTLVQGGQQIHAKHLRADLDPRLPLVDGKMECVTCHSLTAGTDDLLVEYSNPYDLCLGCHTMQQDQPVSALMAILVNR